VAGVHRRDELLMSLQFGSGSVLLRGAAKPATVIPDSVVDNFEEILYEDEGNSLSDYYSGSLSDYTRDTSSPVIEGDYSLKQNGSFSVIYSTSGLPRYPGAGDTTSCYFHSNGSGVTAQVLWFVGDDSNWYGSEMGGNGLRLVKNNSAVATNGSVTPTTAQWYELEANIGTGGSVTLTAYTVDSNGDRTGEEGSVSHSFDTGDSQWDTQGIGFRGQEVVYDSYEIQ